MTRRFVDFVLMQAQQIALLLGQIPGPDGRAMEPNLPVAKVFIDQLDMIREKTRGNLTKEEEDMLAKVLAELQLAFVEVGRGTPPPADATAPAEVPGAQEKAETPAEEDSKRKFTKSYG